MATIGNILIGMSATTQRLQENLQGARKHLADFAGSINLAGAAFVGFAGALAGGVAIGAIKGMVEASAELGANISKTKVIFGESAGVITSAAQKMADQFGVVKSEFIDAAASFGAVFKAAGKNQNDAARLGVQLAQLAGDLASFDGKPVTEALTGIQAALRGEFDPLERFRVFLSADAVAAEAVALGLAKTTATVDANAKKFATLNLILKQTKDQQGDLARTAGETDNQLKRLSGSAQNAQADLGMAFQPAIDATLQLTNAILSGLGGAIMANGDAITAWAKDAAKQGGLITQTFEFIGTAAGVLADTLHGLKIGFKALQVAATAAGYGIVYILDAAGKAVENLLNLIPGVKVNFTSTLDAIGKDLGELVAKQADELAKEYGKPLPSAGIKSFFDEIKKGAAAATQATKDTGSALTATATEGGALTAKISELTNKLREQVATFGMSSTAIDIFKLKQAGASDSALAEARALATQVQGLEDAKKVQDEMQGDAKQLFENTRTPAEKFAQEMAKIDSLLKAGLIDPTTASRASEALGKDLAGQAPDKMNAAALDFGSAEARSAVLAFQNKGQAGDSIKDLNKVSKDHFTEATRQTVLLAKIANGAGGQPAILAF